MDSYAAVIDDEIEKIGRKYLKTRSGEPVGPSDPVKGWIDCFPLSVNHSGEYSRTPASEMIGSGSQHFFDIITPHVGVAVSHISRTNMYGFELDVDALKASPDLARLKKLIARRWSAAGRHRDQPPKGNGITTSLTARILHTCNKLLQKAGITKRGLGDPPKGPLISYHTYGVFVSSSGKITASPEGVELVALDVVPGNLDVTTPSLSSRGPHAGRGVFIHPDAYGQLVRQPEVLDKIVALAKKANRAHVPGRAGRDYP